MAEGLEDFVEVLSYWSSNHLVAEVFDKFHANARNLLAQFTTSVEAMVRFQFEQSNSTKQAVKPTAGPGIQGTREDNHGFVGLINLGNICYITACIQQLYMSPPFAEAILSINDTLARTTDLHHLDEAAKVRPSDLQVFSEVAAIFQILATSSQRSADPAKLIEAFSQLPLSYNVYELGNAEESMRLLLDRGYEVMLAALPEGLVTACFGGTKVLQKIEKVPLHSTSKDTPSGMSTQDDCPPLKWCAEVPLTYFSLPVSAGVSNLYQSLAASTNFQLLEGTNQWKWPDQISRNTT